MVLVLLGHALPAQRVASTAAAPDAPPSKSFHLEIAGERHTEAIAVDGNGNIFLAGTTDGALPRTNPEMAKRTSRYTAFVTKFDPNGQVLWTSFVGGTTGRSGTVGEPGGDFALDIAVDPNGQPVIVGRTTSTDFPVVNAFIGNAQATNFREFDGFVTKLSSDGKRVIFSSYFGGRNGDSRLIAVATGPAGETWIAGQSWSNEISTHFDVSDRDSNQVIVIKLNPAGGVVWSTRMSGVTVSGLSVDGLGQPHVAAGCPEARQCSPFVAKLSSTGSQLLYRERVDGGLNPRSRMAVTSTGNVVVAAGVSATADPWPSEWGLAGTGFVRVLNPSGKTIASNSVNSGSDGIHIAASDRVIVAFNTGAIGLPTERALVANHVDGPMYASDDGAATWTNLNGGGTAESIQIDPERNQVFAGAFRSDDEGRTWVRADVSTTNFAIDPRRPNIHWSASRAIYRRVDGGPWQQIAPSPATVTPDTVTAVAVNPHDGTAWVGGDFGVDLVSDDGRYRLLNDGLPSNRNINNKSFERPQAFAFDPIDSGTVYVATTVGLYGRSAADSAWSYLTSQIDAPSTSFDRVVEAVGVDPANGNVLVIGRHDGMYRSIDRGRTWQYVMNRSQISSLVFDPNRPGVVYATGDRIYRSLDHGATWQQTSVGYDSRSGPSAIGIHPKTSRLYVSSSAFSALPFVMELGASGPAYTRSWATYLNEGAVFDLAMTPSGAAVVGTVTYTSFNRADVGIVRIGQ